MLAPAIMAMALKAARRVSFFMDWPCMVISGRISILNQMFTRMALPEA
jgi:hypothetical protein